MTLWERTFFNNISGYIAILNKLLAKKFEPQPLKNHIKILGGNAFKSTEYVDAGIPVIRISDFQDEKIVLDRVKYYKESEELSRYELHPNDIIIAMTGGTIGKLAIVQEGLGKIYLNQRVGKFNVINPDEFEPEYIYWIARGVQENIKNLAWGGAQPNVSGKVIESMKIPFPDKTTQKSIISFLRALRDNSLKSSVYFDEKCEKEICAIHSTNMSCAGLSSEITHQQTLLKKLRQQILQDAISGKLTAKWREENPDTEPASELLARIKAEKERLVKEKVIKKQKPLPPISDDEIPFELPGGWCWCRLGELVYSTESGKSFKCTDQPVTNTEWGIIKTSAVTSGTFVCTENKLYKKEQPEDISKAIKEGDLIFCRASGSKGLAGKCCKVEHIENNLLLSDKTIRVFTDFPDYILLCNNSDLGLQYYNSLRTGKSTSMNNVTRDQMLSQPIPMAPSSEITEILKRLKRSDSYVDQLEAQSTKSQQEADLLMQAVLKEAFEG